MTVSLTTALLGRNTAVSLRLGALAIVLGMTAVGTAGLAGTLSGGGPLSPRGVSTALALGTVGVGGIAAVVGVFRNSGLFACWLLVGVPVAGLVAVTALAGGIRDTGLVDAVLSGGSWGIGVAVTAGSFVFAVGTLARWASDGRLTV